MQKNNTWTTAVKKTATPTKHVLSSLSIKVRTDQFHLFKKILKPTNITKTLDVGVASDEILKDSNMFEKLYEYPKNLTVATIEDKKAFQQLYPEIKVVKIKPNEKLPFRNNQFDIVTSWATLEHVGGYNKQEEFLNELLRVGKNIFVTTPHRGCIYEPHTGFFFLHWLPLSWFRYFCKILGQEFWSNPVNLNPLYTKDLKRMKLSKKVNIGVYKMLKLLPSHLIVYTK